MNVIVIGGGASGMTAALTAARAGHSVRLLERQNRVGRKLLATGNGRCNLTNLHADAAYYHGARADFVRPALEAFPVSDTLDFFRSLGLLTVAEESGRVYPLSDQAGSVLDVLRFALLGALAEVRTDFSVTEIKKNERGFAVSSDTETLEADRVIVCCGGKAGGKLGGTGSGYDLLASLGHRVTPLFPALVQIKTDPTFVRSLKGVRADAAAELMQNGKVIAARSGEVQFTEYGVSGPVIFDLSRAVSTARGELTLRLDCLRSLTAEELTAWLRERVAARPALTLEDLLVGSVHNRLGRTLLRSAGFSLAAPVSSLKEKDLPRVVAAVKSFTLPVSGTLGFDGAQVTAGGADTAQFDPHTLQSTLVSGLYAAGEVLDVDGDCGGYNLQWAWSSGRLAGELR
ncbi:MAG: NAD(P)/FAD-dependent oxidoreductase [Oscillibacter sp.]|nr:NAD(P)/FAD-dependent oxidoreductase [Oscillibacter sp.]